MKKVKLIHFFGKKNDTSKNPAKFSTHPSLIVLFVIFFSASLFYLFPNFEKTPNFFQSNLLAGWTENRSEPVQCDTTCSVNKIIDGDTFYCQKWEQELKIRLIGVDTPEIAHDPTEVSQFGSLLAKQLLIKHLPLQENVCLSKDPISDEIDKYNRHLFFVNLADNTDTPYNTINELLMAQWLAQTMTFPNQKQAYLQQLEKHAIQQNLGIRNHQQRVTAFQQASKTDLTAENIANYWNKNIYFTFRPQFFKQTNNIIEFFASKNPDYNTDFRLIIFKNNLKNFQKTGIIRPDRFFLDKELTIYGKIKKYKKFYEVVLNSPLQVIY